MKQKAHLKQRLCLLLLTMLCSLTGAWAHEITVYDGTATNNMVPAYVLYFDDFTRSQFVIPAADVSTMAGGTINSLKFYTKHADNTYPYTTASIVDVYLMEVGYTTMTALKPKASGTIVYQGELDFVSEGGGGSLTIEFTTPYTYNGGNLLIGIENTTDVSYKGGIEFYGTKVTGAAWAGSDGNSLVNVTGKVQDFIPKTTFTYTGGTAPMNKPTDLTVTGITPNSAWISWETRLEDNCIGFTYQYKKASEESWSAKTDILSSTAKLEGLTPATSYNFRVKARYAGGESAYATVDFTTDCDAVSIPFTEGFEGDIDCWSLVNCTANTKVIADAKRSGENGFRFYYSKNPPQYLISPELTGTTNGVAVTFYYQNPSTYTETFMVGYSTTTKDPSEFTWDSEITAPTEWTQYENVFPAGTKYVAVKYTANDQNRLYLDDFSFTLPPSCVKPRGLTVSNIGVNTAVVSWTSSEPSFDIDVNGNVTENVTNPYTLTGLTMATSYTVKVRAKNSKGYSEWSNPVSFFTDACSEEDKCFITLELTDSYGDGWGANAIKVVDHETGSVLGTFANTDEADADEAQIFTLAVCPGREIDFVWVQGSYSAECSWVIKDVNDEEICSGQGDTTLADGDVLGTFLVDCTVTPWRTPTGLTVSEIGPKSVTLSWTERSNPAATAWVVAYKSAADADFKEVNAPANPFTLTGLTPETAYTVKVRPAATEVEKWSNEITFTTNIATPAPTDLSVTPFVTTADVSWNGFAENYELEYAKGAFGSEMLQYDDGIYDGTIGNNIARNWTWGVMYPASMLNANKLAKISIYETSAYNTEDITIDIYQGGDDAPGTLLYSETVTPNAADAFHEISLASPVDIDPEENLWITLTEHGTYVLSHCDSDEPNNDWILYDGSWAHIGDLASSLAGSGWMIRGEITGSDPSTATWISVTNPSSPCTLEGLTAETQYTLRVRGDFGSDGKSDWVTRLFTTKSPSAIPVDLAASDLTATSATLKWTGYQNSYQVRYREAEKYEPVWEDDFEHGLDQWTIGGTGEPMGSNDLWYSYNPEDELHYKAHSGTQVASSWSWYNQNKYNAENWLVTPQLDLQGRLRFYVRANESYPDNYEVLLSTTGNTINTYNGEGKYVSGDFTVSLQGLAPAPATGKWAEVVIDLSAYVGQKGYIAIHHVDYDSNYLFIDDFGIYNVIPAGAWTTATVTEPTLALTGLTRNTEYEWQVQGNLTSGTTAWSEMASFTTSFIKGDANNDGQVTITDAVAIVNYILGNPSGSFSIEAADVNQDGSVSITDAVSVVNIILNNGSTSAPPMDTPEVKEPE